MSKKMANKILAAVLSLGAVMSNGSTSSAMEKTDKKHETQNSKRNEFLDYGKKGWNAVKKDIGFKDLLYIFGFYKIYNKVKNAEIVSSIQSVQNALEVMKGGGMNDFGTTDYDLFFDVSRSLLRSPLGNKHLRSVIVANLVNRIAAILYVRDKGEKENENEENYKKANANSLVFGYDKASEMLENKLKKDEKKPNKLVKKEDEEVEEGGEEKPVELVEKKDEPGLIINKNVLAKKYKYDGAVYNNGGIHERLKALGEDSKKLSKFLFKGEIDDKLMGSLVEYASENLSLLFDNFTFDEILVELTKNMNLEREIFTKRVGALYNLCSLCDNNDEFKKVADGKLSKYANKTNKFLRFLEGKLIPPLPPKEEGPKIN